MALRNLVEAQCGETNPLISLSHHFTTDKAHKEDTYFIPHHEAESYKAPYGLPVSPEQLAEEFMNETRIAATATPQAFRMDTLLQEMQAIERVPPAVGPAVADLASQAGTWCKEFLDSETQVEEIASESELFTGGTPPPHSKDSETHWWTLIAEEKWNEATSKLEPISEATKWAQEYIPQEDSELAKTANELLGTVDDPKFSNTEFMKYIRSLGQIPRLNNAEIWQNEFIEGTVMNPADSWSSEFLREVADPGLMPLTKPEEWSQEFLQAKKKGTFDDVTVDSETMTAKERENFWDRLQQDWNRAAQHDTDAYSWLSDFEANYGEPFKDYTFKDNNPLKDHPDPLSEGKKCLDAGDIPSAVLCFEAAVQQDPDSVEAWLLLGTTHAENEQDPAAIPALRRVVDLDPANLEGWMSLASSYTNESYQNYACGALREWIKNNREYQHLIPEEETSTASTPKVFVASLAPREQIEDVQSLYLKAANIRPNDSLDADVQCGLGILLNLTGDYNKAVDCFQAALHARPMDPQLWNKLGATLANSSRSPEAIEAYRNALGLSPGFIRCRYNLGIACINLGAHREAMEHFLEVLNLQEKSRGGSNAGSALAVSDNIWTTVKVCLRRINAQHLLDAVYNRDLKRLNEEFASNNSS